jgi:hypothetical protein
MARLIPRAEKTPPQDDVLQQLRIPFVRRATLVRDSAKEEVFVIDIGLAGVFVERSESLKRDERLAVRFAWPGSERPFEADCRVAWWHPPDAPLSSKSLPSGGGLEFVTVSEPDRARLRAFLLEYCQQQPHVRRFLRHWPQAERFGDDPTAG